MKKAYQWAVDWMERGDLVPLIIIVSIPHYISVMQAFEFWPVAVAMGILTDLGHYRTILVYLRSSVGRFASVFWMLLLTGLSYAFHVGFYALSNNVPQPWPWYIGAVPPILIFAMAYISKREGWGRRKPEYGTNPTAVRMDYRNLSSDEKAVIGAMSIKDIVTKYRVSDRTASNWRKHSQEIRK